MKKLLACLDQTIIGAKLPLLKYRNAEDGKG